MRLKVGFISVYNTRCGIATYKEALIRELEKLCEVRIFAERNGEESTKNVRYCWNREKWPQFKLMDEIDEYKPDIILFSHEYGILSHKGAFQFTCLVSYLKWKKYKIYAIFHSIYKHQDKSVQECCVPNVIVHSQKAKDCLISKGITHNDIHVLTHGIDYLSDDKTLLPSLWNTWGCPTIFQAGFSYSYKNFSGMLDIFKKVLQKYPNAHYVAQMSVSSKCAEENERYYEEVMNKAKDLDILHNVTINKGFISMEAMLSFIRTSTVTVYPYKQDPEHAVMGATGAVRIPLVTETPIIVSDVNLFDDLKDVVLVGKNDDEIVQHICNVFAGKFDYQASNKKRVEFINNTCWAKAAEKLYNLFRQ
jgi:glycosyltransferase involved in cell wall biosynthesis